MGLGDTRRDMPGPAFSYKNVRHVMEFIVFTPIVAGVAAIAIGIAMEVREAREKQRKMAELEAALAEAKGKIAAVETHSAATTNKCSR
jgi:hypothetical protein